LDYVEFCLGMGHEPSEILWVSIKEQTNMDDLVDVCYRPPNKEDQVDEARSTFTFNRPCFS